MSVTARHIDLARTLPPRLQRFFAHNPPRQFYPSKLASPSSSPAAESLQISDAPAQTPTTPKEPLNPFLPNKNPRTGRWNPPIYSLREQADLVKLAKLHGVEELLPFTIKGTEEKERKKRELGSRIKGTGVGQSVKGHKWERGLKAKLDKRREAMLAMPKMVKDWKRLGHGKGWKKWPK